MENLVASAPPRSVPLFYRTAGTGAEMRSVFWKSQATGFGLLKSNAACRRALEKGFFTGCEDVKPDKRSVVNSGAERYLISQGVEAINLKEMATILAAL